MDNKTYSSNLLVSLELIESPEKEISNIINDFEDVVKILECVIEGFEKINILITFNSMMA